MDTENCGGRGWRRTSLDASQMPSPERRRRPADASDIGRHLRSSATPARHRRMHNDDLPRDVSNPRGAGWRTSRDHPDPGWATGADSRETTDPNRPSAGDPLPSPTSRSLTRRGRRATEVRHQGLGCQSWWIVGVALIHVEHRMSARHDGPLPSPTARGPRPRTTRSPCRRRHMAAELVEERDGAAGAVSPD